MPGLFGIISSRPPETNDAEFQQMARAASQEPFYVSGTWHDDRLGVYVGWSSIEGSFSDCMPVWNEKRDVVLLFHGEHVGDKEELVDLKRRNHAVKKHNASYLVHVYEEKGPEGFVRFLNGHFHGVLVDLRTGLAFLFNDRFGYSRVYFHQAASALYFSSEVAPLLRVMPDGLRINSVAVEETAQFGEPRGHSTLFQGVEILPEASIWTIERQTVTSRSSYFGLDDWDNQTFLGRDYFCERLNRTLKQVLSRHLRHELSIGIHVTEGSGSQLVLATAELPPGKSPCVAHIPAARPGAQADSVSKWVAMAGQEYRELGEPESQTDLLSSLQAATVLSGTAGDGIDPSSLFFARAIRKLTLPAIVSPLYFNETFTTTEPVLKRLRNSRAISLSLLSSQVQVRTPFLDLEVLGLLYRAPAESDFCIEAVCRAIDSFERLKNEPEGSAGAPRSSGSMSAVSLLSFVTRKSKRRTLLPEPDGNGAWLQRLTSNQSGKSLVGDIILSSNTHTAPYFKKREVEESLKACGSDPTSNDAMVISRLLTLEILFQQVGRTL